MDAPTVLVHWLHVLALALWVGGLVALSIVLPAGRRVHPADVAVLEPARRRAQTVMWWSAIALVGTLAVEIGLRAHSDNNPHGFVYSLHDVLIGPRYGWATVARWILAVVLLFAVDEMRRAPAPMTARVPRPGRHALGIVAGGPRPRVSLSRDGWLSFFMLLAAALQRIFPLLTLALLASTAIAGPFGGAPLTAIADTLHLGATTAWLGGTIVLALAVAPFIPLVECERRPLALLSLLDRFTPIAMLGVLVLAATGLWETTQSLRATSHLFATTFGVALAVKTVLLAIMICSSVWGVMVLRPRLRRLGMRGRRDRAALARADDVLATVLRLLRVNPVLAVLALGLGAVTYAYPDRAAAATSPHKRPLVATRPANAWQPLGPNVIAHSLVVDPANHARMYEGTVAGVARSLDGGAHWAFASTGLAANEVWSLTLIPDGSLLAATSAGIYRSTDGARHWHAAGLGTRSIYTIATHLSGHIVLLAGGNDNVSGNVSSNGGIYRSDDLARTWRRVYDAGPNVAVTSLAWPSVRPSLVVAGIHPGPYSIVVSRDGGVTWHADTRGLPTQTGMMSVAVAPGARDVYGGMMGLGAYVLPGITGAWKGRNSGLPGLKTGDAHIGSFAFDPSTSAIIYVATPFGVYKSADAGRHWSLFGRGLNGNASVVTALTLVTGARPTLYATTAAGLYRLPLPVPRPKAIAG